VSSYIEDFWAARRKAREEKAQLTPEQRKLEEEKICSDQRQKAISYKKFFGEDHHKAVMLDLMNRYFVLTPLPRLASGEVDPVAEGQRSVVLDLLSRANVSMEQLDKILKGEFV
jgi:hypothetical protein